jgi:hypothetical protein
LSIALVTRGQRTELRQGVVEMADGFRVGDQRRCSFSGASPVDYSQLDISGFGVMPGNQFGLRFDDVRELLFEDLGDLGMYVAAAAQQKRMVGGIPDQGMPEDDIALAVKSALLHQLRLKQTLCRLEYVVVACANRFGQKRKTDLSADDRGDLCKLPSAGGQSIKPRHEGRLQRVWNFVRRCGSVEPAFH